MMRRTPLAAALALALLVPAFAQADVLDDVVARGVLRVGTTGDYKPFSFSNPVTQRFEGMDIDLAADLAQSLGVRLELVPTTWGKLMPDLQAGRFDIGMGGVSINLARQRQAQFSLPYLVDGKTPITLCSSKDRFQTLAQINQPSTRLIVNPGGTNEKFAQAHFPQASLTVYPDNVSIFTQIVDGKADLMVTDAIETRLQEKLHPELCAVHPDQPFDYSEKAYALPNDWRWKNYVDQWLHLQIATGSLKTVQARWVDWPWLQRAPQGDLQQLVALVNERLKVIEDVARSKWNSHGAIEDPERERSMLASLQADAARLKLAPERVQRFFEDQIEAAKTLERERMAQWQSQSQPPFAQVQDLKTGVRPRLDAINQLMLQTLARLDQGPVPEAAQIQAALKAQLLPRWGQAGQVATAHLGR